MGVVAQSVFGFKLTGPRWTNPPVTMRLQLGASPPLQDGSGSWDASAASALATWNASAGTTIFSGVVDPGAAKASGNGINNVFFSPTVYGSAWGNGVLAVAISWSTGGGTTFTEGDVLFNSNGQFTWNSYGGNLQPGLMDFRRVALHEFGHVLGLDHPDQFGQSVSAIMNSTVSNLATLTADDIAGAQAIYGGGGGGNQAPIIQSQPSSVTAIIGDAVSFSVSVFSNLPVSYQWRKNNVAIPGATSSSLTLNNVTAASAGSYTVFVSNSAGSVTSNAATLTVGPPPTVLPPTITQQPVAKTVNVGASVTFTVVATGEAPLTYFWEKDGAVIAGATSSSYTIPFVQITHAGNYRAIVSNDGGPTASSVVKLTVGAPPAITTQPTDKTVVAGTALSLTVVATGNPEPTYQWRKNGVNLLGATGATFTVASAQLTDAGSYTVVVTNSAGSVTSAAAIVTVNVPPVITTQPVNTTLVAGTALNLSVIATGTPTPTYQWRKNGVAIPGATAATFTIASVQPGDAASYAVVVTNAAGSVTSSTVFVTVNVPPLIVTPPAAQTISAGSGFSLTVVATGTPAPAYQWRKNGVDIPGATSTTFAIAATQPADGGAYSVVVTNVAGSITSVAATVTVNFSRLVNLSTRGFVPPANALTAGFVIRGTGTKQLVVRAIGPTLLGFGVGGALDKVKLDLIPEGVTSPLASNNGWGGLPALAALFTSVGAFELAPTSQDSAVSVNLSPGNYSVRLTAAGASPSGVALAEIYDADSAISPTRLFNLSTLGFAGTGDQTLTVGFAVRGNIAKRVLIRAVGPGLTTYGVPGLLADPRLQVIRGIL